MAWVSAAPVASQKLNRRSSLLHPVRITGAEAIPQPMNLETNSITPTLRHRVRELAKDPSISNLWVTAGTSASTSDPDDLLPCSVARAQWAGVIVKSCG